MFICLLTDRIISYSITKKSPKILFYSYGSMGQCRQTRPTVVQFNRHEEQNTVNGGDDRRTALRFFCGSDR